MKLASSGVVNLLSVALGLLLAASGSASSSTASSSARIAYAGLLQGKRSLIVTDDAGRLHRRLTRGKAWLPSWSPDGKRIAFARGRGIWIVDTRSGREARLTGSTRSLDLLPAWSPDGRWIAFVRVTRHSNGARKTVMLVSPQGTAVRRLAEAPERNDLPWGQPAWSPDGRWIAFHVGIEHATETGALRIVHVTGRDERLLTDKRGRCGGSRYLDSQPSWSPDGRWIAFLRNEQAICVVRPDGSGLRRLTPEGGNRPVAAHYYAFAWAPDGRRIAYATRAGIGVLDSSRSGSARFLTNGGNPAWSPDGRKLAFTRDDRWSSAYDLYMIDVDGTGERRVAKYAFDVPVWSPR